MAPVVSYIRGVCQPFSRMRGRLYRLARAATENIAHCPGEYPAFLFGSFVQLLRAFAVIARRSSSVCVSSRVCVCYCSVYLVVSVSSRVCLIGLAYVYKSNTYLGMNPSRTNTPLGAIRL